MVDVLIRQVTDTPAQCGGLDVSVDRRSVVFVRGELDHETAPMLAGALASLADRIGDVTIDVADLEFIDAAGIKVLCAAAQALGARGGIVLRNPSPTTRRAIDVAGIDDVVDVVDTPRGRLGTRPASNDDLLGDADRRHLVSAPANSPGRWRYAQAG